MNNSIEDYTVYLFGCKFADDVFDPDGQEDHLKKSWELFDLYSWSEIFPVWFQYLQQKCKTVPDVINFVNLYIYYDAADKPISNPLEFISYLYYRVDMDQYWDEAGDLFDGLAINILSHNGYLDIGKDPYYTPLKDEHILHFISDWKNGKLPSQKRLSYYCRRTFYKGLRLFSNFLRPICDHENKKPAWQAGFKRFFIIQTQSFPAVCW